MTLRKGVNDPEAEVEDFFWIRMKKTEKVVKHDTVAPSRPKNYLGMVRPTDRHSNRHSDL